MRLSREALRTLARDGARRQLRDLEQQLALLFGEFPDLFLSDTPPQLLKAERRPPATSRNGTAPAVNWNITATPPPDVKASMAVIRGRQGGKAGWTPARRKAQARRMKNLAARQNAGRRRLGQSPKATKGQPRRLGQIKNFTPYRAIQAYMAAHGPSRLKDLTATIKAKHPANVSGFMKHGIAHGYFKKVDTGVYALGTTSVPAK